MSAYFPLHSFKSTRLDAWLVVTSHTHSTKLASFSRRLFQKKMAARLKRFVKSPKKQVFQQSPKLLFTQIFLNLVLLSDFVVVCSKDLSLQALFCIHPDVCTCIWICLLLFSCVSPSLSLPLTPSLFLSLPLLLSLPLSLSLFLSLSLSPFLSWREGSVAQWLSADLQNRRSWVWIPLLVLSREICDISSNYCCRSPEVKASPPTLYLWQWVHWCVDEIRDVPPYFHSSTGGIINLSVKSYKTIDVNTSN